MIPCRNFAQGGCAYGAKCSFLHAQPQLPPSAVRATEGSNLRANATVFSPTALTLRTQSHSASREDSRSGIPCKFLARGLCGKGQQCPYSHDDGNGPGRYDLQNRPADAEQAGDARAKHESEITEPELVAAAKMPAKIPARLQQPAATTLDSRKMSGAFVKFSPTVEISSVKLASELFTLQILRLPLDTSAEEIQQLLEGVGFKVALLNIGIKPSDGAITAEISADDPVLAEKAVRELDGSLLRNERMSVRKVQTGIDPGILTNRVQLSTVLCSWYKASRVAWAHYRSKIRAQQACEMRNGKEFSGRMIQCKLQPGTVRHVDAIYSVQIGNLPVSATRDALRRYFTWSSNVVLGPPSSAIGDDEAYGKVRDFLEQSGPLDSFEPGSTSNPNRSKAFARFKTVEDARKAVRDCGEKQMPGDVRKLGLHLNPVIVVKFSALKDIYEAVKGELEDLRPQMLTDCKVNLTVYPPTGSSHRYTLRISGEDRKMVAKAKGQVEATLTGSLATSDNISLWHEFFCTPEGLQFLHELRTVHGVFLYSDVCKRQITLYGHAAGRTTANEALRQKIEVLATQTQVVNLTPELLKVALHGGYSAIIFALGKRQVRLDIQRKILTVRGGAAARTAAENILKSPHLTTTAPAFQPGEEETACPICYTQPTDPYQTPCGHTYCKDCFVHQISSCNRPEDFPIRCHGSQGNCNKLFDLAELERVLAASVLDALLLAAFTAHIRARPHEYQYCPTADCDQVYRPSSEGGAFDCPNCMNSICTSCKVISHEGYNCAEYKDLTSEGNLAFQLWKEKNKVKPCPKCKAPIEKESGCNHMTCAMCQAHICWFCMRVFQTGQQVYQHMGSSHNDMYE